MYIYCAVMKDCRKIDACSQPDFFIQAITKTLSVFERFSPRLEIQEKCFGCDVGWPPLGPWVPVQC